MAEYAGVTAKLLILFSSLTGVFGSALPSTSLKAASLVSAVARSSDVSGPQAYRAYAKASYPKPALRYLYAAGWIDADSHLATCKAALLFGPDPSVGAATALQGYPKFLAQLRTKHITISEAATALGRGLTDGCV